MEETKPTTEETKATESVATTDKSAVEAPKAAAEKTAAKRRWDIKPGMTVKVHQKIRETTPKGEEKERIQFFEGMIIYIIIDK